MALTKAQVREILSAAGVDSEHMGDAVEKIIDGHLASVNALREEIGTYKAESEKLPALQKELETAQADLAASKKDSYKVKYEAIKEDFEAYKAEQAKKDTRTAKETAYRALLKEAGVSEKRIESVLKVSDVDSVELTDKGEIKGADKLSASIKDEWADFIETTEIQGVQTPNPPANTGGSTMTKEQIMNIKDTGERHKAIAEHHELFGI